jgi:hypothetical protein
VNWSGKADARPRDPPTWRGIPGWPGVIPHSVTVTWNAAGLSAPVITRSSSMIVILVSDLFEGGNRDEMLRRVVCSARTPARSQPSSGRSRTRPSIRSTVRRSGQQGVTICAFCAPRPGRYARGRPHKRDDRRTKIFGIDLKLFELITIWPPVTLRDCEGLVAVRTI